MDFKIKQISSLEKVLPNSDFNFKEIESIKLLKGQSFSYQIAFSSPWIIKSNFEILSPILQNIKAYRVENIISDMAQMYPQEDDDFITQKPALIPDMLCPVENGDVIKMSCETGAIWIQVSIPNDLPSGKYPITIKLFDKKIPSEQFEVSSTMTIEVINEKLPEQSLIFTQWFHVDCIADIHKVKIYSQEHWNLIEKYMVLARSLGINMILTPVITPPLNTAVNSARPCTQLVKISKDTSYHFDFSLLDKWIELCKKVGFEYYEISHLFSQWGLKFTPNISVTENGTEYYKFGWTVDAKSNEYEEFLRAFLPALIEFLKSKEIKEKCFFHISDEPKTDNIEEYEYAQKLVTSLIDGCVTFDALSDYDFYKKGLVKVPIPSNDHIEPFLKNNVKNLWTYYCSCQVRGVSNRLVSMPSYRNRIIGIQMYKYNLSGFLQWGYNFYYNNDSTKIINPYLNSSANREYPSGDSFSVYPIENGVVPSLRALVFKEALEDIEVCRALEQHIGRKKVIDLIDEVAGMNVTFTDYPRNSDYIPSLIEKMIESIKNSGN